MRRWLAFGVLTTLLGAASGAAVALWVGAPMPEEATEAVAEEPAPQVPAVARLQESSTEVALQIAVRTYVAEEPAPDVVVVSSVHVADAGYYAELERHLDACEVVICEGVAPRAEGWDEPDGPGLEEVAAALGLAFQSTAIDHEQEGWRNADLTSDELHAQLIDAGAEPEWADRLVGRGPAPGLGELLERLETSDPRLLAHTRLSILEMLAREGPGLDEQHRDLFEDVIIGARDAVAIEELQVVRAQEPAGPVCLLYGAAHAADLDRKLAEVGYEGTGETWLTAMTVRYADIGLGPVQLRQFRSIHGRE